jgi:dTDP-4-amino-4,6-dideoxygalactose transaminase
VRERPGPAPAPAAVARAPHAPRRDACARAAPPPTGALLVAHHVGTRLDPDPWVRLARERGWLLLEDCAQAFVGLSFTGHPAADVSMFSFGPIKTQTALAGGVLLVRDAAVLERMRGVQRTLPVAGRLAFARRVAKYTALKLLSSPRAYGAFARLCDLSGSDLDAFVRRSTRGFAGGDLFVKLRHQPSAPLCALLERRLARFDDGRLARRTWSGEWMSARRPSGVRVPGVRAPRHSYWVYAVELDDPERVPAFVTALRGAGFDATHAATLEAVPAPDGRPDLEPTAAAELMAGLVYLPVSHERPRAALVRLAELLERELGAGAGQRVVELLPQPAPGRDLAAGAPPRARRPV